MPKKAADHDTARLAFAALGARLRRQRAPRQARGPQQSGPTVQELVLVVRVLRAHSMRWLPRAVRPVRGRGLQVVPHDKVGGAIGIQSMGDSGGNAVVLGGGAGGGSFGAMCGFVFLLTRFRF